MARLLSASVDFARDRAAGQRMRSALTSMLTAATVIVQKVIAATYTVTGQFSMTQRVQKFAHLLGRARRACSQATGKSLASG